MLAAARDSEVKRFVYAASSSTYGDHPALPKVEPNIGKPSSPDEVTKLVNELYGDVFTRIYDFNAIGLRYLNLFGKRQDPSGGDTTVIPTWTAVLLQLGKGYVNVDGKAGRGFRYIANAVRAKILAATTQNADAVNQVYNVALGDRTSLNDLYKLVAVSLSQLCQLLPTELNFIVIFQRAMCAVHSRISRRREIYSATRRPLKSALVFQRPCHGMPAK